MKRSINSGERGQMILIAGLLIAVLLVGLAVVVNSAIYIENVSTRDTGGSSGALADDIETKERLAKSMQGANYYSDTAGYGDRRERIERNVSTWNRQQMASSARNGRLASSQVAAMQNGTRVSQDEYGNFMPAESTLLDVVTVDLLGILESDFRIDLLGLGDKKNWIIANDTDIRAFEITVDRTELEMTDPNLLDYLQDPLGSWVISGSSSFWVEIDADESDDEYWRIYLFNDDSNSSVKSVVAKYDDLDNDGDDELDRAETCSVEGTNVTVRVTGGELVGNDAKTSCPILQEATEGNSNSIYYAGADEVKGTYRFIADKNQSEFRDNLKDRYGLYLENVLDDVGDFLLELLGIDSLTSDELYHDASSGDSPYTTTAVYNTSVEMTYRTDRMRLTRNLTVAPESPGLP